MNKTPVLFVALMLVLPATRSRADAPAQIGMNFVGSTFGVDSDALPADANGAVGPSYFVELINGRFSVYDKTSGTRVLTMTDLQFWAAAGVTIPSTRSVSDPRLIFDPGSQRWFASMIDLTLNARQQRSNHFLVAVSQTADPTGAWKGTMFAADPNNLLFADFPTLGLDETGLYLSGDMFDRTGNSVGPILVSLSKGDLLADPSNSAARVSFGTLDYTARGNILQPAITVGKATTPEAILAVGDLGLDFQNHNTVFLSSIADGGTAQATLTDPAVLLTVPDYTVPINPEQPDGSNNLDDGDARLSASVRRVGDVLYATHGIELNERAAVRWYRVDAASGNLIEAGTIADPNLELFYPSIAANEFGTVVITCNGSSTNSFISSYVTVGTVQNGALTFGGLTLLKAGTASYQNTDSTGTSRWGDYSTTSVDPLDPSRFWTIQMLPRQTRTWITQITEIITPSSNLPLLKVNTAGGQLFLSWPASASGYELQTSSTIGPSANWTTVSQSVSTDTTMNSVGLSPSAQAAFFRLIQSNSSAAPPANGTLSR